MFQPFQCSHVAGLFEEGVYTAHCVLGILQFGLVPYQIVGGGEFGVHVGCPLLIGLGWRPAIGLCPCL